MMVVIAFFVSVALPSDNCGDLYDGVCWGKAYEKLGPWDVIRVSRCY